MSVPSLRFALKDRTTRKKNNLIKTVFFMFWNNGLIFDYEEAFQSRIARYCFVTITVLLFVACISLYNK